MEFGLQRGVLEGAVNRLQVAVFKVQETPVQRHASQVVEFHVSMELGELLGYFPAYYNTDSYCDRVDGNQE